MRLNPFSRKRKKSRGSSNSSSSSGGLSPYAKKAIIGIILIIFSLIAILSFFNQAGPIGEWTQTMLTASFGWLGYFAPILFIALGGYFVWPQRLRLERMRVIGLAITIVSLLGMLHIFGASSDDAIQAAAEGRAGGYLGFLLSFPLSQVLSRVATTIIFIGSFLIGLILTFKISPADIWQNIAEKMATEEDEESEDEEYEEEPSGRPQFNVNPVNRPEPPAPETNSKQAEPTKILNQQRSPGRRYRPAILKLLHASSSSSQLSKEDEKTIKETIRRTLEQFGIQVEMGGTNVGPTVTQYTLRPEEGTKLSRITALQNDLALALAAHPIRIEAPIPNTNLVGIEIPNKKPALVRLRDLVTSKQFKESESSLTFPLGRDVSGKVVVEELDRLPHLLIAGATGAGKSVSIHNLLISWLYKNSPEALKIILVDPKRVELTAYKEVPHLLTPVIVDVEKTVNALKWALQEMETRYQLLEDSGSRNLVSFNLNNPAEAKPYIVIVIDELADLMVKHAREVEGPIVRLSQMARAVGIHLVLATQRPSVNVLTGLIKANIPARVAFTVASQVDSRTILDMAGAEKLVGNGDMLYLSGDKARPMRIQGGFVSEEEVRNVVEVIKASGDPEYDDSVVSAMQNESGLGGQGGSDDPKYVEAKNLVIQTRKASASFLQRRLQIGYARAARILDMLEENQVVGAAEGNKPRPVLVEANSEPEPSAEEDNSLPESFSEERDVDVEDEDTYDEKRW